MIHWENQNIDVDDVFGQSRDIPLNYIERKGVDDFFLECLDSNKHLVVYGSSKQGKTSLRKHNLSEDDYISIHCSNKWDLEQINTQILKKAGFELTASTSTTVDGKAKIKAGFDLFTLGKGEAEIGGGIERTTIKEPLEIDISDVNDIIFALQEIDFNKFIVLEDFHYLKTETQQDFAIQLKAFHENSKITFVVIGVWLEENRLILLNGDLAGRVLSINADEWSSSKLLEVIQKGENLLNIKFSDDLSRTIVENCNNSVFILQEVCLKVCKEKGVEKKSPSSISISLEDLDIFNITKDIVDQQSGRYNSFLSSFSLGFQETELEMYKWLLYPILTAKKDELNKGFSYRMIKEVLQKDHPNGNKLNLGNLTLALKAIASLQIKKNVKPNILDYDQSNLQLNIVDKGFIIWLEFQDKSELLSKIGLPIE